MTRSLLVSLALTAPLGAGPRTDALGDPLPDGAVARFGTIRDRVGSARALYSFALSPDGKTLAAETWDGITLWDTDTGRPALRLPWQTWQGDHPRFALVYSADGRQLARLAGRRVQVFDPQSGKERFDHDLYDRGNGAGIAFVPGTTHLMVTSEDHPRAFVFDLAAGKLDRTIEFEPGLKSAAPDGRHVLGQSGKDWHLIDPDTGRTRARLRGFERWPTEVCVLSPDGRRAYLAGEDGSLRAVAADTGKKVEDLAPPPGWDGLVSPVVRLALSPDGSTAYLSATHRTVFRRDLKAGKWLDPLPTGPDGPLLPHPDGKRLLVVGEDGVLRRYDLQTRRELPGTPGFEESLTAYPSPDGRRVAIQAGEGRARTRLDLFEVGGRRVWSVRPGDAGGAPIWSPDGRRLVCVAPRQITVRDAATGEVARVVPAPARDDWFGPQVYFPPGGGRLVAPLNFGGRLRTVDLGADGPPEVVRLAVRGALKDVSPDGRALLYAQPDGGLRLFDRTAGRFTAHWPGPGREDRQEANVPPRFSPDGSYVLAWQAERGREPTWAEQTLAVLHDPVTLAPTREFEADEPEALAFSPDGLGLAVARRGGKWSLWDVPTGARLGTWEGHRDAITSIGFAGPGRVLTGSNDLTALVWDLRPKAGLTGPLWEALAGRDADDAFRAMWALAADPKGPDLLRAKVTVGPAPSADKVRQWIADLGADRFAVREAATRELQALGRLAEPALQAARQQATAEEERARLGALLAKIPRERTGAEVAQARAVHALELAGTEPAAKLLAEWAAGPAGARLTIDAKAALGRLGAR